MLRRLKAWYFMIAFGVLFLGGGIFGYLNVLNPILQARTAKDVAYKSACSDAQGSYQKATSAFQAYPADAQHYLQIHQQFQSIQNTMPDIYDMKTVYGDGAGGDLTAKQRTGLQLLYQWMQHGKYTAELRKWAKGYHLNPNNTFANFDGKLLGYEDTFTSIHLVQVDFGVQHLTAFGYADLLSKLQKMYGYNHFPLIILGEGGAIPGMTASAAAAPGAGAAAPAPGGAAAPAPPAPGGPAGPGGGGGPMKPAAATMSQSAMLGPALAQMAGGKAPSGGAAAGAAKGGPPPSGGGASAGPGGGASGGGAASGSGGASSFGSFTIAFNPDNPRGTVAKPALDVTYHAFGFFFLKGWDPDDKASEHVAAAHANITTGKVLPTLPPGDVPPLVMGALAITVGQVGPPPSTPGGAPGGMTPPGGHAPAPSNMPTPAHPPIPGGRK